MALGGVKRRAVALLVAAIGAGFAAPAAGADDLPAAAPLPADAASDRLVVRFRPGTTDRAGHLDAAGADFERTLTRDGWLSVSTDEGDVADVHAALDADPAVAAVDYDYERSIAADPNDQFWTDQDDYLDQIRLVEALDKPGTNDGAGTTIAVLDTGIDLNHPDLAAKIVFPKNIINPALTAEDNNGHGTAVAGVAAAVTNNNEGIAGVAPGASIMPVKVLNASGSGFDSNIAAGIEYAVTNGADVINMSLSGDDQSDVLDDAIEDALSAGVVVVAATGNEGSPLPTYPAATQGVVAVGATGDDGTAAWFSNRGSWVDVAAPGMALVTTHLNDGYAALSGTSLASPVVAGVAALIKSDHQNWTDTQIADQIRASAKDRGPAGFDPVYGFGTVDALGAVGGGSPSPVVTSAGGPPEPNASIGQSTLVAGSTAGEIKPEGDEDWYAFDAAVGTWTITVTSPTSVAPDPRRMDTIIDLFAPNGAQITSQNAAGAGVPEVLTVAITAAGRYFVKVTSSLSSRSPGTYSLSLAFTPPPPPPLPSPPSGYWMVGASGSVYAFGGVSYLGGSSGTIVDLEPTPSGLGYWLVAANGSVSSHGNAGHFGNVAPSALLPGETVTSLSRTPSGNGYWIFTTLGRVFTFGDAPFLGDLRSVTLNGPILDSVSTPSGFGYFMVGSDGGVFAFGNAAFAGSMGGQRLNAPVQSLVPDSDGNGYWLVALDGGIFAFNAPFRGSMGGTRLNRSITGMVRFGNGYLMVGEDGGIFNFSDQPFFGSLGASPPAVPIVSVAASG